MKKQFLILILLIFGTIVFAESQPRYLNIIIVSDLSDRNLSDKVNLPKFPIEYDLMVIEELLKQFKMNVKRNLYITSMDKICFISLPINQALGTPVTNISEAQLSIDMNNIDVREKRKSLNKITRNFYKTVKTIYSLALNKKTIGADIWSFFNYDLGKYIIDDPSFRNILVLLTDGYLYFDEEYRDKRITSEKGSTFMNIAQIRYKKGSKNNRNKILPVNEKFTNLEILMLGVDPIIKYNNREYSIIRKIWAEWFDSMKVKKYKIVKLNKSGLAISKDIQYFMKEK